MTTDLVSGPSSPRTSAQAAPLDRDRRLTVRRHIDLGRCASAFCPAG